MTNAVLVSCDLDECIIANALIEGTPFESLPNHGQSGSDPLILAGTYCNGQSTGFKEPRRYNGCIGTPALDKASTCGLTPSLRRRRATSMPRGASVR